jgi:hypothetical protein
MLDPFEPRPFPRTSIVAPPIEETASSSTSAHNAAVQPLTENVSPSKTNCAARPVFARLVMVCAYAPRQTTVARQADKARTGSLHDTLNGRHDSRRSITDGAVGQPGPPCPAFKRGFLSLSIPAGQHARPAAINRGRTETYSFVLSSTFRNFMRLVVTSLPGRCPRRR